MEIRTLDKTTDATLLDVFNEAFSDYLVPMHLSEEQLLFKRQSENIASRFSVGAFHNGKPVGFILTGVDEGKRLAYNAGTGVVPPFRGKGLTKELYAFLIPLLKKGGILCHVLEVIENNHPAMKAYSDVGFCTTRKLLCLRGSPSASASSFDIRKTEQPDWKTFQTFWNVVPSWQNNVAAVQRTMAAHACLVAREKDKLLGYIVFQPSSARVRQLAVHPQYRRRGIGSALLGAAGERCRKELTVIGVDESGEAVAEFFAATGLKPFCRLLEMKASFN